MKHAHLTEEQLITMCVAGTAHEAPPADVTGCASCEARLTAMTAMLRDVSVAAESQADAVFPPERLARQHARILHRLAHHGRLGRVLAFPYARPAATPPRPMRRWVAGAAAAGLVVGMVAGHLVHDLQGIRVRSVEPASLIAQSKPMPLQASTSVAADDDFLWQIESVLSSTPEGLQRLDSLIPTAWGH
jgi:hypothetical protein